MFRSGLDLKDQLDKNPELLDFQKEQSLLKEAIRNVPNLGEERASENEPFLGIRYPLVCWLDEIFILDSPWKEEFSENALEWAFFSSNERAWTFWRQAELAESRVSADVLEVFFLCVTLGFRGEWRDSPEKLKSWHNRIKSLLFETQARRWPSPDEIQPPTYVPPLTGESRKHSMILGWAVSLLILIPVAMFYIINRFLN